MAMTTDTIRSNAREGWALAGPDYRANVLNVPKRETLLDYIFTAEKCLEEHDKRLRVIVSRLVGEHADRVQEGEMPPLGPGLLGEAEGRVRAISLRIEWLSDYLSSLESRLP